MANLQIRKKSDKVWEHIPDDNIQPFIISKFYFSADGLEFQVVEQGQSRRNKYALGNISVFDDTSGGSAETFSTMTELALRLEVLRYPAFYRDGETVEFNLIIEEDGELPISNVNKLIINGATVTNNNDGSVTITITGGGGGADSFLELTDTPSSYSGQGGKVVSVKSDASGLEFTEGGSGGTQTLQDVRDENPNVSVENPDDENNTGVWNSLQYVDDQLQVEEKLRITGLSGTNQQITERFQSSNTNQIQGSEFNTVTENGVNSVLGVEQGKVVINQEIQSPTETGSHKIELDPVVGVDVVFKTASDETAGTKLLATREWVNANVGGGGIESVTGDGVDNTDPLNPVISYPTRSDIGLGNVDNTSDEDKPISTATLTALNLKEDKTSVFILSSPYSLTSQTALQSIMGHSFNVVAGTYRFKMRFSGSSFASSNNLLFGTLGTATVTFISWDSNANKQNAFPATNQINVGNSTSATSITGSSSATNGAGLVEGVVTFSDSGTFILAIGMGTASAASIDSGTLELTKI